MSRIVKPCYCIKEVVSFFLLFLSCIALRAQNAIVTENANPGVPISQWGVPDFKDNRIAGFTTNISVNRGETVYFKIDVQGGVAYTLKIYRLGYYGGNGARGSHHSHNAVA